MLLREKFYDTNCKLVIALDGPSASGKGAIGRTLADLFKLRYFESGIMYRGLAFLVIRHNLSVGDKDKIIELSKTKDILAQIHGIDLLNEEIAAVASVISAIPEVRHSLTAQLTGIIAQNKRILMEGRDIGTVVAPNADLKLYITADVKVRAERRYKQLLSEGKKCILHDILEQLINRDKRDSERLAAPLKPAGGAYIIDTSNLELDQVIQKIKDIVG